MAYGIVNANDEDPIDVFNEVHFMILVRFACMLLFGTRYFVFGFFATNGASYNVQHNNYIFRYEIVKIFFNWQC